MKKIKLLKKFGIILILITLISFGCNNTEDTPTEPEVTLDNALVGTWQLTKITVPLLDTMLTAQEAGVEITMVFRADGSFEATTIDSAGTEVDKGTWSTSNSTLTLKFDDGTEQKGEYTIQGNVASLNWTIDFEGYTVPAILEFVKASSPGKRSFGLITRLPSKFI